MKPHKLLIIILCFSVLISTSCSSDDTSNPQEEVDLVTARLQAIIDDKVGNDTDKLVGVSISIRVGSEERWNLVGGISKLNTPAQSDMRFGVGSVTKTVVAN